MPTSRRRRTIPIQAVVSPQEAANRAKAYVPPAEAAEPYRDVDYEAVVNRYMSKIKNPKTAIRARCIQCCNGQMKEVTLCTVESCALHPFRLGENPFNLRTKAKNAGLSLDEYKAANGGDEDDDE